MEPPADTASTPPASPRVGPGRSGPVAALAFLQRRPPGEEEACAACLSPCIGAEVGQTEVQTTVTRIEPPSAAPGATITVYGEDLNPEGAFVAPRVVFETRPTFMHQPAQAISNTELKVVVPPGSGTIQVHVQTAAGRSNTVTFTYKTPWISTLDPPIGERGEIVTIVGEGFGIKRALDPSTFVKFGDSVVQPAEWDDLKIVVRAPMDFGTGTNDNILLGLLTCAAGYGLETETAKLILDLSLPGCADLFSDFIKRYQMATSPNFLERQVPVVVRTAAGTSNQLTFTYRVQAEISPAPAAPEMPRR